MAFLELEREVLEALLPGLDAELSRVPLAAMEAPGSPALALYRAHGGPGLLVPAAYGGAGASPLQMVHVQRALGSRSPSLAIATNMHSCTVAAIPPCAATAELLGGVARHGLLLASGFADGQSGASILAPRIRAERVAGGWRLRGSKKPCSLAHSMNFLTASVLLPSPSGEGEELALATIPAEAPGLEVRPFGAARVLAGSETHEIALQGVYVPDESIAYFGKSEALNAAISKAFLSFELLVSASYLGAASALVERVLLGRRGTASERALLAIELEGAQAALEGLAHLVASGAEHGAAVARALFVRYAVQRAIERASAHAAELLGGMAFLGSDDVSGLYAAARALAFHPPSRLSIADALDAHLAGGPLLIP